VTIVNRTQWPNACSARDQWCDVAQASMPTRQGESFLKKGSTYRRFSCLDNRPGDVETNRRDHLHVRFPPNRGHLNSNQVLGTHVPVEEPSTA
jgi:hypothetical protein